MRKITNRAISVLLIAVMVVVGMTVYLLRYIDHGQDWAMYFSRANSGSSGQLVDRNGIMLAYFSGSDNLFSPDEHTRRANYHVTGDYWGRTGTGLISRYLSDTNSFSLFTGTTHSDDSTLTLNIDARLNNIIYEAMGSESSGAMLVCNYRTGELIGMVSTPTVDPLDSTAEVREGAYINRCLSASFIPGSIFKLVTSAAAIESIPDIRQRSFYCEEEYEIAGVPITCTRAHYTQSFDEALANSCNIAFAQIAVLLGHDTMIKYVTDYGFLSSHELDGISCVAGSYPTEFIGDPELGWSGIGQSTDMVCPYAMLRFVSAIANGGTLVEPHILQNAERQTVNLIKPSTAEAMKQLMKNNFESHYAYQLDFSGLRLCAKTGTAELGDGDCHSWFVGFLDDEEHPYAFVTLIERGGYGIGAAGGVTNQVLQWAVQNT